MIVYVIYKASRATVCASIATGYTGPACKRAGVAPGRVYECESEAHNDAQKLAAVNPCGFAVVRVAALDPLDAKCSAARRDTLRSDTK